MTQEQIKEVLVCCKNYDAIINFKYPSHDYITEKLISVYQEYLFQVDPTDFKMLNMAKQLDQVMQVYISTKSFYRFVQDSYVAEEHLFFDEIADVIALYHDYIKEEMKSSNSTKWI